MCRGNKEPAARNGFKGSLDKAMENALFPSFFEIPEPRPAGGIWEDDPVLALFSFGNLRSCTRWSCGMFWEQQEDPKKNPHPAFLEISGNGREVTWGYLGSSELHPWAWNVPGHGTGEFILGIWCLAGQEIQQESGIFPLECPGRGCQIRGDIGISRPWTQSLDPALLHFSLNQEGTLRKTTSQEL